MLILPLSSIHWFPELGCHVKARMHPYAHTHTHTHTRCAQHALTLWYQDWLQRCTLCFSSGCWECYSYPHWEYLREKSYTYTITHRHTITRRPSSHCGVGLFCWAMHADPLPYRVYLLLSQTGAKNCLLYCTESYIQCLLNIPCFSRNFSKILPRWHTHSTHTHTHISCQSKVYDPSLLNDCSPIQSMIEEWHPDIGALLFNYHCFVPFTVQRLNFAGLHFCK